MYCDQDKPSTQWLNTINENMGLVSGGQPVFPSPAKGCTAPGSAMIPPSKHRTSSPVSIHPINVNISCHVGSQDF